MRASLIISTLLLAATAACAEDPLFVMAVNRAGRIEFFDSSLAPLASIGVNQNLKSVTASPDGRRLYIAQESMRGSGNCCGVYSLDLATRKMCQLDSPAMSATPSPDGRFLFMQGKRGVDVFDGTALVRLATMKAPGAYTLQPSSDGRWLLGVTNSPKPSLDVFDMQVGTLGKLVRQLPIPAGPATGTWAGELFYIFTYGEAGEGKLWSYKPEETELKPGKTISLPDYHGDCNENVPLMLAGAADRLFIAEAFGFNVDRSQACPDQAQGGVREVYPSTGNVFDLAPSVRVKRMAPTPNGRELYLLDSGERSTPPRLIHIDTATMRTLHIATLEPGEWNLSLARIPAALVPRRNFQAANSCSR